MEGKGVSRIWNVNEQHERSLSALERAALFTTEKIGSMGFFFAIAVVTIAWVLWNTYAPEPWRFDPFPAFVLWLFISNMLELLFMPLIMIGQNLQGRHAEARAQSDYEVNVRAEREIQEILARLEKQEKLVMELLRRRE